jgi:hydroxyacyl-ACP dehydratase HTD2-like protein with hotdog domain
MIHYSDPWCRQVESHPKPVVHGPLNLINIMDLWRDNHGKFEGDAPNNISYRALAPLYAGDSYTISMKSAGERIVVEVAGGNAKLNMSAEITQ